MHDPIIQTERLHLRQWREEDMELFIALNQDEKVREYFFPRFLSPEESKASLALITDHIERLSWGFWAASLIDTGEFIGCIGLEEVYFNAHFNASSKAIGIGWRLANNYWGKGYATEGAKAALKYGFKTLNFKEIVSYTTLQNGRSKKVMEKIGMHHDPKDNFEHPKLPQGHPLSWHALYRIQANEWQEEG